MKFLTTAGAIGREENGCYSDTHHDSRTASMIDDDSYRWSEAAAGPLGAFARGIRSSDAEPLYSRTLPHCSRADGRARLLADAQWSSRLGAAIAVQPLQPPDTTDLPRLVLAPGGFAPLGTSPGAHRTIDEALRLGRAAAVVLARLHAKGFVHGALCPWSLWVDAGLDEARLAALDLCFTDAGTLHRQPQPEHRHDLRYLAPELSTPGGRADRRADLYAFGVLLYEALTGRVPFETTDSVGIHHAHSAVPAQPPLSLRSDIPPALSELVALLLAKDPDERYQSASGVRLDLERIQAAWEQDPTGSIVLVGRSLRDSPRRPASLFGREREMHSAAEFLAGNERGSWGLLLGPSGSGKSSLVDHVVASVPVHWLLGRGTCDQVRHEPFAALRTPIQSILGQIESGNEKLRRDFARAASSALSGSGAALQSIVPGIERYLDNAGPLPRLAAQAGERRVHAAFHALLAALASIGRPVAVVLDDVQWADAATLAVLRSLSSVPGPPPAALLLSCRADEVDARAEVAATIAAIREHSCLGLNLEIEALGERDLRDLVAHCLDAGADEVAPLAAAVHRHSQGNPLFAVEELHELWRSGALQRDAETGAWRWPDGASDLVSYSNKLSELITRRLHRLPQDTRRLVARAACFGRDFDPAQLASVAGVGLEDLRGQLEPAFREGVLVAMGSRGGAASMRFGHDQIRSAALATLDEETRLQSELQIGSLLLGAKHDQEEGLLVAIVHLNAAAPLLRREGRERWLARRNLDAARVAVARAAYADAYGLLGSALDLLGDSAWQDDSDLMREVHLEAARAACLSSAASSALPLVETLRSHARNSNDEVAAMEVAIEAHKVLDRFREALDTGLDALAKLGIALPPGNRGLGPMARLILTHWRISRRGKQCLTKLPAMEDPRARAAMRILTEIATPCFLTMPALFPAIVNAQLRLSLDFGNAPESAYAYALYAVILAGPLRSIAQAHDVGMATLQVLENTDRLRVPRTHMAIYVFVMPWNRPLPECLSVYLQGSKAALQVGDPEFANYHASAYAAYAVHAGPALETVCAELDRLRAGVAPFGQQRQYAADIYHQFCLNLRSGDGDPLRLAGPVYDEAVDGAAHAGAIEMNGHLHLVRLMLAVLFDRHDELEVHRLGFRASMRAFDGMYVRAAFFFYEALALLRSRRGAGAVLQARATLRRLRRWQRHAPDNFAHKVKILKGELARRRGRFERAQCLFEEAATAAATAGFVMEAGLALEGARASAAARGLDSLARHFLGEKRKLYGNWGATAKLRELDIRFGSSSGAGEGVRSDPGAAVPWDLAPASLDLVGVLEASQALSAGMELEATIRKILQTVVGLSGAQRGLLVRGTPSGFVVLATAETVASGLQVEVFPDDDERASAAAVGYPASVVREVGTSGAALILSDPARDPRFRDDPHLQGKAPRALLCCPVARGHRQAAVLYLEHDLRRDAFGPSQLETVRLLSTQAAISLDNARLYARQLRLSSGAQRFVPHEFLLLLGKGDVDEVALSNFVNAEMTLLVCDIRGFTTLTETMTPERNFAWINEFFAAVGPVVRANSGFVIKYMGDGLMALFPRHPNDAAAAAIAVVDALKDMDDVPIGIGLHTGIVAVGAVGESSRLQADVMSDVVTVACRLESLTRHYDVPVVMSSDTRDGLSEPMRERTRPLGRTAVKGRVGSIDLFSLDVAG
ncbi:MAG: AAA family ATPase [Candidatus Binatia bacterium]